MPFRKRPAPTPADDRATAATEVARAKDALRHWKQIQAEAIEQIASMEGVSGWIANVTGRRQAYLEEAHARLAHAKHQLIKERNVLVAAQQALDRHQHKEVQAKKAADEHLLDLELVASNLRQSSHHAAQRLNELENTLDSLGKRLIDQQALISAAGAVRAHLGTLSHAAAHAQSRVLGVLAKVPEVTRATTQLPEAVKRLNTVCADLGLPPVLLDLDDYRITMLMDPTYVFTGDTYYAYTGLRDKLEGERNVLERLQDQVATERQQLLTEQAEVFEKRRALLEQV